MAAKKTTQKKSTNGRKAQKTGPAKATGSKKKSASAKKSKKAPAKLAAKKASRPCLAPLGRPKVSAEEKLFMLFHDDFHARQIFDFLRAETLRDLERHSAAEIIRRLSAPIQESIDRIRRRLADYNRYLAGDENFVRRHKEQRK